MPLLIPRPFGGSPYPGEVRQNCPRVRVEAAQHLLHDPGSQQHSRGTWQPGVGTRQSTSTDDINNNSKSSNENESQSGAILDSFSDLDYRFNSYLTQHNNSRSFKTPDFKSMHSHAVASGRGLSCPEAKGEHPSTESEIRHAEPSAPPLPTSLYPFDALNNDLQQPNARYDAPKEAAGAAFQGRQSDPWVRGGDRAVLTRHGAASTGLSNLLTPAAGAPPAVVSGLIGRLTSLKGMLTHGLRGGDGGRQGIRAESNIAKGGGIVGTGTTTSEDGQQFMQRMRDILLADTSLFKVEEGSGRGVSLVDGDVLRLRLRQQQPGDVYGGAGGCTYDYSYDSEKSVVQMQIGDILSLELNPPGAEPLPFLKAAPGVYTFRCSPDGLEELNQRRRRRGGSGGGGGASWPLPAADSSEAHERHVKAHRSRGNRYHSGASLVGGNEQSTEDSGGGRGGGGGNDGGSGGTPPYYYCLTVSPTICDNCTLDQLDTVLASYTRLSHQPEGSYYVPATIDHAASQPHRAAASGAFKVAAGVVSDGGQASASASAAAGAPASAVDYLTRAESHSYGTVTGYPAVHTGTSGVVVKFFPDGAPADVTAPSGGGGGAHMTIQAVPQTGTSTAGVAVAAAAAAWEAAAAPDSATRLATRVIEMARAVGEAVVAAAHSLAYDIRRRADELVRRQPSAVTGVLAPAVTGRGRGAHGGSGRTATLLPLRAMVVAMWLLARAAAVAVGVVTEVLAAMGAAAAEFVLFSGALFSKWIPLNRSHPGPMGLRGDNTFLTNSGGYGASGSGNGRGVGGAGGRGLVPGLMAALAVPSHLARAMTGTALLVYGELHGSLEEAARVLLRALADAATQLAAHAGGPEAEGLTRGTLEAVGYAVEALTGVRRIGLRAVAREYQRRHAAAVLAPCPPPPPPSPPPTQPKSKSKSKLRRQH